LYAISGLSTKRDTATLNDIIYYIIGLLPLNMRQTKVDTYKIVIKTTNNSKKDLATKQN
jgi:hypothetical protein